jgi:hypothetical protein
MLVPQTSNHLVRLGYILGYTLAQGAHRENLGHSGPGKALCWQTRFVPIALVSWQGGQTYASQPLTRILLSVASCAAFGLDRLVLARTSSRIGKSAYCLTVKQLGRSRLLRESP